MVGQFSLATGLQRPLVEIYCSLKLLVSCLLRSKR